MKKVNLKVNDRIKYYRIPNNKIDTSFSGTVFEIRNCKIHKGLLYIVKPDHKETLHCVMAEKAMITKISNKEGNEKIKFSQKIAKWMHNENRKSYLHCGMCDSYNTTRLAEQASVYFGFENDSEEDQLCFEIALEIVEEWELETENGGYK